MADGGKSEPGDAKEKKVLNVPLSFAGTLLLLASSACEPKAMYRRSAVVIKLVASESNSRSGRMMGEGDGSDPTGLWGMGASSKLC